MAECGGGQHVACGRWQRVESSQNDFSNRVGGDHVAVATAADEFGDEERVAAGVFGQPVDRRLVRFVRADGSEHLCDVGFGESFQPHSARPGCPSGVGQQPGAGRAFPGGLGRHVGVAPRGHDGQVVEIGRTEEVVEDHERLVIGPMEVFEADEERSSGREPAQRSGDGVADLAGRCHSVDVVEAGEFGDHPAEVARLWTEHVVAQLWWRSFEEVSEDGLPGAEGCLRGGVDAAAPDDVDAILAGAGGKGGEQGRFSDAGRSGDDAARFGLVRPGKASAQGLEGGATAGRGVGCQPPERSTRCRVGAGQQCRVVRQDLLFELGQQGRGVEAELLQHGGSRLLETCEGIGDPACSIEGEHVEADQLIAGGVLEAGRFE